MACFPTDVRLVAFVAALSVAHAAHARAAPPTLEPVAAAVTHLPPTPAAVKEARDLAKVARKLYDGRHFAAAAELYRKAYRLDYAKPDYLYGVGRCEQRAGNFAAAVVAFEQLLALLPPTDQLVPKAKTALLEVRAAREADLALPGGQGTERAEPPLGKVGQHPAAEPTQAATPDPATQTAAPPAATVTPSDGGQLSWADPGKRVSRSPAVVTFSLAAAAALTGVVAGGAAIAANVEANAFRVADSGAFDPARISKDQARARIADINFKTKVAGIAGATAALAGAVGAWLWPRAKGLALGVDGDGVVVGGRF